MRSLLALVVLAGLTSCSSLREQAGCVVEEKVVDSATAVISSTLQCKNTVAVRADVKSVVDVAGLCKTGMIGDLLCPRAVEEILKLTERVVPSHWQCSAANAKEQLKTLLVPACKSLVPVQQ